MLPRGAERRFAHGRLVWLLAVAGLALSLRPLGSAPPMIVVAGVRGLLLLGVLAPGIRFGPWLAALALVGGLAAFASPLPALAIDGWAGEAGLLAAAAIGWSAGRDRPDRAEALAWFGLLALLAVALIESCWPAAAPAHWLDPGTAGVTRLGGQLFANPNTFASVALVIGLTLVRRPAADRRHSLGWLAFWATSVLVGLTGSRGAAAGWLAGAAAVLVGDRARCRKTVACLAIGGALLFLPGSLGPRLAASGSPDAGTVQHRLFMWSTGLQVWRQRPWLGVGPGVATAAFGAARDPDRPEEWAVLSDVGSLHNDLLQTAAEQGLAGIALLLALGWSCWRRRAAGPWPALAAYAVTALFHSHLSHPEWALFPLLLLATSWGAEQLGTESPPRQAGVGRLVWAGRTALALATLLAAWQMGAVAEVQKADGQLAAGRWLVAESTAADAILRAPWLASAHLTAGWAALGIDSMTCKPQLDAVGRAVRAFGRAAELDPYNPDPWSAMAEANRRLSSGSGGGLAEWREALRRAPYRASLRARIAEACLAEGANAAARQQLAVACDHYHRQVRILARRGQVEGPLARRARSDLRALETLRDKPGSQPVNLEWTGSPLERRYLVPCADALRRRSASRARWLVRAVQLPEATEDLLAVSRSSGRPVEVVVPWAMLLDDPNGVERLARPFGSRILLGIDGNAMDTQRDWLAAVQYCADRYEVQTAGQVTGLYWQMAVVSEWVDAARRAGWDCQVAADWTAAGGLVDAPFRVELDWPRLLAYLPAEPGRDGPTTSDALSSMVGLTNSTD